MLNFVKRILGPFASVIAIMMLMIAWRSNDDSPPPEPKPKPKKPSMVYCQFCDFRLGVDGSNGGRWFGRGWCCGVCWYKYALDEYAESHYRYPPKYNERLPQFADVQFEEIPVGDEL